MVSAYLVYPSHCSYPPRLLGVYYRVFFDGGAVPTQHPATPDDPFLGRVLATSIAPPRNVDSITCGLMTHEDVVNHRDQSIGLYSTESGLSTVIDNSGIDILNHAGTGSTPGDALDVVVHSRGTPGWDEPPDFVDHYGPTGTRCRKKFLPCFHRFPLLILGPIICKSITSCTTRDANCHRECLSTWSNPQSGASWSIGLHHRSLIHSTL